MLERLRLQGFKNFLDQEIAFGPLVVLVGANASGKSNLLDAIRFLHGVGLEMSFVEILRGRYEGGREVWPPLRGGISEIATKGREGFELESTWSIGQGESATHHVAVNLEPQPQLVAERLSTGARAWPLFPGLRKALGVAADRSALTPTSNGPVMMDTLEWGPIAHRLLQSMRSAVFLDITPTRMRDYAPKAAAATLGNAGENVSAVVWQLCQDPPSKTELVDWLSELCAPELTDIDFVETSLGDVMIALVERSGWKIPARALSDGTLRFLGQLIALRTAPPGSLLLIEEVDSGLHPSRIHLLVEAIETATSERDLQVIATTHSPLVVDALSKAARKDAVLVAHDPAGDGSVIRRLGDLPHFDAVAATSGVDRLLTTGWLERAL